MADLGTALIGGGLALLGVVVAGTFQYANVRRTDRALAAQRLRDERMSSYAAYAGALMEFRRALRERFGDDTAETVAEARRTRSAAWHAWYRVLLVTDDAEVVALARQALWTVSGMRDAADEAELDRGARRSRADVERFVVAARSRFVSGVPMPAEPDEDDGDDDPALPDEVGGAAGASRLPRRP